MNRAIAMAFPPLVMALVAAYRPLSPGRCVAFAVGVLIGGLLLDGIERLMGRLP